MHSFCFLCFVSWKKPVRFLKALAKPLPFIALWIWQKKTSIFDFLSEWMFSPCQTPAERLFPSAGHLDDCVDVSKCCGVDAHTTRTDTHTDTRHTDTHTHAHTYTHRDTHRHAHAQTHRDTHTRTDMHRHAQTHTHTHRHTQTHTDPHRHAHTQTHTDMHTVSMCW
jgi:hypothetical protein